jgi:hypothetical protein
MATSLRTKSVTLFDRAVEWWWVLFLLGIAGIVLSILGEFVFRWWRDEGTWGLWLSVGLTIVAATLGASHWQANRITAGLRDVRGGVGEVQASSERIEGNTQRIEGNTQRTEANTAEAVALLREIRDRLPLREG